MGTLLKVGEVAEQLGITAGTVREMIKRGDLNAFHVGMPGAKRPTLRVPSDDLDRFLRTRKGESEPDSPRRRMSPERAALRRMAAQA